MLRLLVTHALLAAAGIAAAHCEGSTMHILEGGLDDPRVIELLHVHLVRARAETAPGSACARPVWGAVARCDRLDCARLCLLEDGPLAGAFNEKNLGRFRMAAS
jgi:hypothetical protein